jgi:hypothetical protein
MDFPCLLLFFIPRNFLATQADKIDEVIVKSRCDPARGKVTEEHDAGSFHVLIDLVYTIASFWEFSAPEIAVTSSKSASACK